MNSTLLLCRAAEESLISADGLTPDEAHRAVDRLLATGITPDELDAYLSDLMVLIEAGLEAYFAQQSSFAQQSPKESMTNETSPTNKTLAPN